MRLEWLLIVLIGMIVSISFSLKLEDRNSKLNSFSKELEFTNTTFIQVDTKHFIGSAYSTYGVRTKSGVLNLSNINYHTDNIKSLSAKSGKYVNSLIYLDNDVVLEDNNGSKYMTQHAYYNQQNQILYITSDFIVLRDKNSFKGKSLVYNTISKELSATKVEGIFYTSQK